jgi:hypothetical protein
MAEAVRTAIGKRRDFLPRARILKQYLADRADPFELIQR